MGVTQTVLERIEKNMLKWHVLPMEDNKLPKPIITWSPEGRRRRGRPAMKCEREVKRMMKQKNLTPEDALNWQLW
jgi:hypothetical protein